MTEETAEQKTEEVIEESVGAESSGTLRAFDPFLFLIGHRGAILRIAATPWAFLVGALFVVTAGVARNYDHHLLTQEPIWVVGPFVASIFTTTFIFIWVWLGLGLRKIKDRRSYLTFLTLVWMTAPCAWIYGIPVESYTDIVTATKWNIGFLAIVSLWRVVLMIRAISVLTEAPAARASLLVITPAALEMMVGAWNKGLSLVGIMGGVRLSPEDELLLTATNITATLSFWAFLLGTVLLFATKGRAKKALSKPKAAFPRLPFVPATLCLLLWLIGAMPYLTKLRNQQELETFFRQERYEEALAFVRPKEPNDFPASYHLPPHPESFPPEVLMMLRTELPDWVREAWTDNAFEAVKSTNSFDDLHSELEHHPELEAEMHRYAKELEEKGPDNHHEGWWLKTYREKEGILEELE